MRNGIVRTAPISTTAALVIGPNDQRVALMFSTPSNAGTFYTVSTDPGVTLGGGVNLLPTVGPVTLTIETHGDVVQRPWYGIASSGMATIGIIETVSGDC